MKDLILAQRKDHDELDILRSIERAGDLISPFLSIPGLVGFWPMSSVQRSTGNAYDVSGQGLALTYNGNPTYNYYNNLVPYIDLDGTGDYLIHADNTELDILGTETIYASGVRGLTLGGWFWLDSVSATQGLIGKSNSTGNQRAYFLAMINTGVFRFQISTDGTATMAQDSSAASSGVWYWAWGRFIPSTSLTISVNGVQSQNTTAIPASIFNSSADLAIGALNGAANFLDGRASLCFLSGNALSDQKMSEIFQSTRGYFGV